MRALIKQAESIISRFESVWGDCEESASSLILRGADPWRVMHAMSRLAYLLRGRRTTVRDFHADDVGVTHYYVTMMEEGRELSGRSRRALARRVKQLEATL